MLIDRRRFIDTSFLTAGALMFNAIGIAEQVGSPASMKDDLVSHMSWLNDPASAKNSGGEFVVRSRAKTDFWQKTFDGYIADSGHFFHLTASGDFTFTGQINGKY